MRKNLWRLRMRILGASLLIVLAHTLTAGAVTREAFLAGLLEARGLGGEMTTGETGAAFVLRTGLVTDPVANLKAQVTRREALRWCVQSLGLAFEAGILSNTGSGFGDAGKLTDFERGCLSVAVRMNPPLLTGKGNFRGGQRLTEKEASAFLQRVKQASRGLKLDVTLEPLQGLTLHIHRDGVHTAIPRWRVCADGFQNREAADRARKFFKARGFDMSALQPQYEWFLRTSLLDNYGEVQRLTALIKKRGLKFRVLPSLSNANLEIAPHYWALLKIDPTFWHLAPIVPKDGPRTLTPLSAISRTEGVNAAINAGFFAVTGKRLGYPIGVLRVDGELLSPPYTGRSCLGWNDEDEAVLGIPDSIDDELWGKMPSVIQAGPLLLDDGQPRRNPEGFSSSTISGRHPRSVVGLTEEGEWFFLVVDGRNGLHALGATLVELTEVLRSCGAFSALNLDGGGSAELIVNGKIYNAPSEGRERSISYGLGVRERE
ncbi:MAG: phosphodiester glycosidase family protein [Fretibacterium sp.]|nr:phosphodiester glycosidase family protein [Fretibacterium sp.]